ncbi:NADPH:quinone oxidoreductase family protein [Novosphingobium rosa]|uniref:NADPH:quinone oxidoreductase family protein n=1 Tax=Novosphingobium rosa TaxID=76978 RepID=UPI0008376295|nr:NADPH:quinone oxidoreductase family protein [Novosphingobium rosa]
MRALVCETFGPPQTLVLRDWPLPEPAAGQVRVRIHAAGVNFPDTLIIEGRYQIKADPPLIPGSEVAGVIEALGDGVEGWRIGDRVCAMTLQGGFAEAVAVDASRLVALPDEVDFAVGSSVLMTYGTAIHALRQRAALAPGERLLVLGAGGGVGLAAVALGAAMGAQVIAAASSAEKLALAQRQGAAELIDTANRDLREALKAGGPLDVVVDPVGGAQSETAFRALAPNGRHLVVGFASGTIPSLPLNLPLLKSAALIGVFWGAFTTREPETHRANMAEVFRMMADGRMPRPDIQLAPLAGGPDVLDRLAQRRLAGKAALTMA